MFLTYWTAASISLAGTLVTAVVLPILVYQRTGSAWQTALWGEQDVVQTPHARQKRMSVLPG